MAGNARSRGNRTQRVLEGLYGNLEPVRVKCPECGAMGFEAVRGRYGPIWRCSDRCEFFLGSRPTGKKCRFGAGRGQGRGKGRVCGALMVSGTATIPDRCSRRDCPNHHPVSKRG